MTTLSAFDRVKRRVERAFQRSGVQNLDAYRDVHLPEIREAILLVSHTLDILFTEMKGSFQPFLTATNLPEDLNDDMIEEAYETFSDMYYQYKAKCLTKLSSQLTVPIVNPTPIAESTGSTDRVINLVSNLSASNNSSVLNSELPRLTIPVFDGSNLDSFSEFHSKFLSLVDENDSLTGKQKLIYLLNHLKGSAYQNVALLPINDDSYKTAWKLLTDRYQNKPLLVTNYCKKMLLLPKVTIDNPASMRDLVDIHNVNLACLESLGIENIYESVYVAFILSHMDTTLRERYEMNHNSSQFSKVLDVTNFLTKVALQKENACSFSCNYNAINTTKPVNKAQIKSSKRTTREFTGKHYSSLTTLESTLCSLCSDCHKVSQCPRLLVLNPRERYKLLKTNKLCISCLQSIHKGCCKEVVRCEKCSSSFHHTLVHFEDVKPKHDKRSLDSTMSEGKKELPSTQMNSNSLAVSNISTLSSQCLLGTSLIRLQVNSNQFLIVRGILDSASQMSFISEDIAQKLGVKRFRDSIRISGIGLASPSATKGSCNLAVSNVGGGLLSKNHKFHILSNIAQYTPGVPVSSQVLEATRNLVLADPTFGKPGKIQCLLGSDLFAASLNGVVVSLGKGMPFAVSTHFGFLIMGTTPTQSSCSAACVNGLLPQSADLAQTHTLHTNLHHNFSDLSKLQSKEILPPCLMTQELVCPAESDFDSENNLYDLVNRFWELEQPPQLPSFVSKEEQLCEEFYKKTTTRNSSGRYVVRLPFKEASITLLGESYNGALSRLFSLERKFTKDSQFKAHYIEFMRDYISRSHMMKVDDLEFPKYFIPHHGIYKSHGDINKIRIVFDCSFKTSSGYSLNDLLLTGKGLQALIADVITLFRRYHYVFCADIEQMFRQILVHKSDYAFQCVLWREAPDQPINVYALKTVTYGQTCAPYLAIRTLKQLAQDEGSNFPLASCALSDNVFVDDFAAGSQTCDQVRQLISELVVLLSKGGFTLKKWISNCPDLLTNVDIEHRAADNDLHGVLGLRWNSHKDILVYPVEEMIMISKSPLTKRCVLAQTAKIFDPCGFISPIVMNMKVFLQKLWRNKYGWDDNLPHELSSQWNTFVSKLSLLDKITIPRSLNIENEVELHGFGDASQVGMAAVLYVRSVTNNHFSCRLIAAKTKVAPLKTISIPRLELQAAYLLSKLAHHYFNLLQTHVQVLKVVLWSDSAIVLHWVKTPPHTLKTFVANRVSQINELVKDALWLHVRSADNPADIASRGVDITSFIASSHFWFEGPPWLSLDQGFWPHQELMRPPDPSCLELKPDHKNTLIAVETNVELFSHISSWRRVLGVMTLILKWIHKFSNCTSAVQRQDLAHSYIIKYIQIQTFSKEINDIKNRVNVKSSIQRLVPYLDDSGLLRARGRLAYMDINEGKHPFILPKHHHLVHLLITYYHVKLGHAGPQHVQYILAQNYWILSARQVIRSIIFKCVRCFRAKPLQSNPLMADLPLERIIPAPVFYNTCMDYCGYFLVKATSLRKAPRLKVYVCIFICMAVKAVHLEVAFDMSSEAFLDVLKRFIARRGCPKRLHSDMGSNFVGGDRMLQKELRLMLQDPNNSDLIQHFVLEHQIEFSHIPPSAPSMGGLWERAVRSFKYHLKRIIGNTVLNVFQFSSLTTQIEGILNSRPITPLSAEPNDCQALTPGHFLLGRPLIAPPERLLPHPQDGLLRHYQHVQALLGHFWRRWRLEYLSTLQVRSKWSKHTPNLDVGDLVIVDEPNCAPLHWPLGRITQVLPSKDGIVRKAEVQTSNGKYVRPAFKLYRLPLETSQ